jgi:hypothetical protein
MEQMSSKILSFYFFNLYVYYFNIHAKVSATLLI